MQEQQKISDSIQSVDHAVEKKRNKLERFESIKKALMQDLLTGKVRVKTDQRESVVA
jgi:type I restriction enzyme S subunit